MKKVHAWLLVAKQDIAALVNGPTIQTDIATLKADLEAMLPELFTEVEAAFAKILLAAL